MCVGGGVGVWVGVGVGACVVVCLCVVKYFNCAAEMLWLVLNDLCAEQLRRDGFDFAFSLHIVPSGWLSSKHQLTGQLTIT